MKCMQSAAPAAALLALFLGWPAGPAAAAPALVTTNVNLRQGPGTTYPVITTIPGGSNVDLANCNSQWCSVTWQGQSGFVIATSIDQGGEGPAGGPPPGSPPPDGPVAVAPGAPPPGYYGAPGYPPPPPYYGPSPYYYGGYYGGYGRGYYRRW